jgi:hypothetical protein
LDEIVNQEQKLNEEIVFEQCLITIRVCYLYALPNGFSTNGYYARQWNLPNPIFTGNVQVFANSLDELQLRISSREGELFVVSGVIHLKEIANGEKSLEYYIEAVKDSSRYYVIRVEDSSSGKKAYLGLGFHDRADSFNFNTAIMDHLNLVKRQSSGVLKINDENSVESNIQTREKLQVLKKNLSGVQMILEYSN